MRGLLSNTYFFAYCFRLNLPRMKKPLLAFIVMALIISLVGIVISIGGLKLLSKNYSPFILAIADDSGDPALAGFIAYLGETDGMRSHTRFIKTDSEQARSMVAQGRAAAALILPEGFLESVDTGDNLSPLLIFSMSRPLETLGVSVLIESAASMLSNAQKGIYLTDSIYGAINPAEPEYEKMIWDINIKYMNWVSNRGDMFQRRLILPTGGELTISRHYLLSALCFFIFLAPAGLLYPAFSWDKDRSWLKRLHPANKSLFIYALAQVIWGAIAILALIVLILVGLSVACRLALAAYTGPGAIAGAGATNALAGPGASSMLADLIPAFSLRTCAAALPGMILSAIFISACVFLCCNSGQIVPALSLCFLIAAAFLILSGGAVPLAFMPAKMRSLSPYSPFTWMRDSLALLYPRAGAARGAVSILGASSSAAASSPAIASSAAAMSYFVATSSLIKLFFATAFALLIIKLFCVRFETREVKSA